MARGAVTVSGEVINVDFMQNKPGADKVWSFHILSVLAGKAIVEVRWDSTRCEGDMPKEGESVSLDVELGVYGGRLQVNARGRSGAPMHIAKPA